MLHKYVQTGPKNITHPFISYGYNWTCINWLRRTWHLLEPKIACTAIIKRWKSQTEILKFNKAIQARKISSIAMDVMYSPSSANPCATKAVNPGPRPNPIIIAEKSRHRKPPRQKEDAYSSWLGPLPPLAVFFGRRSLRRQLAESI